MRRTLLVSAALVSAAVAALALAQTTQTSPTEPGSTETVLPASPNSESATGKPAESGAAPRGGTPSETVNTEIAPPGPAASGPISEPAPGGTTEEHTTSGPVNNKHVERGSAAERHPQRHVAHPLGPEARHASAIERPHRHPPTAPHQTASSAAEENASTDQYLRDAQTAVRERRIGKAQEALERAETRALDSGNMDAGPNSTVNRIERAREALGHVRYLRPDPAQAGQLIDQALSDTASNKTSSLSDGQ